MTAAPIKIAILAMGGEGGGVLSDWIVELGEHHGHIAQSTSVAGVAQRTGATTYYVELFAREAARREGALPVLALMPTPGDVDVVLASELMEAGRAVLAVGGSALDAVTAAVVALEDDPHFNAGRCNDISPPDPWSWSVRRDRDPQTAYDGCSSVFSLAKLAWN